MAHFVGTLLLLISLMSTANGDHQQLTEHTLKATNDTPAIDVDLKQLDWLQGNWVGKGFGGQIYESWDPVAGNTMSGTFRLVEDGQLNFSEFFLLMKTDAGVVLKLKHFHPDFTGWEDKDKSVNFPLLKVADRTAYFGGLTYQRTSDRQLTVWLAMKQQDKSFREVRLVFERQSSRE